MQILLLSPNEYILNMLKRSFGQLILRYVLIVVENLLLYDLCYFSLQLIILVRSKCILFPLHQPDTHFHLVLLGNLDELNEQLKCKFISTNSQKYCWFTALLYYVHSFTNNWLRIN